MAGLALVVLAAVVAFGGYLFFCRWRYEAEKDRSALENLRQHIGRSGISSWLTPTLDEMPYNLAADRHAFIPDDGRPEWDEYRKEIARKREERGSN